MELGRAVRKRRKELKKTLQDVALDIPGYDAGNLSRFERGVQDIDSDKLEPLAKALKTTISELYRMVENPENSISTPEFRHNPVLESYDGLHPGPDMKQGQCPLISWVAAGDFEEPIDNHAIKNAEDWYPMPPVKCSEHTYVLRVEGDSMTSPYGKSYPHGMLIYVDPEQKSPPSGSPVIAKVNNDNKVTFKQYVNDGGNIYLKPLNSSELPITKPFKILGTVVFAGFEP